MMNMPGNVNRLAGRTIAGALFVTLALGIAGCSGNKQTPQEAEQQAFEDVKAEIQSVVTDPKRAAQAADLIDELETSLDKVQADIAKRKANLRQLDQNYDTPREAFETELAALRSEFRANGRRVSAVRQQLTEVLTDEEWAALEKARSKALESALETAQST
jgi:hypothetical protein